MFLVGNYQHALDDKNRIRLPSKYREKMGGSYLLMPGTDGCIFVYPADENEKIFRTLYDLDSLDPERAEEIRRLTENAAMVDADGQGRFILPNDILEIANITKNVRIVGAISKVEIWSEELYQARRNKQDRTPEGFNKVYSSLHKAMENK